MDLLTKRACQGDHCPVDIPTWKIIVFSMIPLIVVVMGIIYLFGIRHYRKQLRREEAADRFEALDWDEEVPPPSSSQQRLGSFYSASKPEYARSTTMSSLSTVTQAPKYLDTDAQDPFRGPTEYKTGEYNVAMQAVPVVKDSTYILPPADEGDDWGYQDPVTKKPGRVLSPNVGNGRFARR